MTTVYSMVPPRHMSLPPQVAVFAEFKDDNMLHHWAPVSCEEEELLIDAGCDITPDYVFYKLEPDVPPSSFIVLIKAVSVRSRLRLRERGFKQRSER